MMPYPFRFANIANIRPPRDNYYGCDPYNTVDAPKMRKRVRVAPVMAPSPDPWAALGRLLKDGRHNG